MNAPTPNPIALLPAVGAAYEGGLFAGLTTDKEGRHFAVVLLPDKPAKQLPWRKAMDWAASVDGTLPTRPVAALLFANAKDQFAPEWHWTCEAFDRSFAWDQKNTTPSAAGASRWQIQGSGAAGVIESNQLTVQDYEDGGMTVQQVVEIINVA